MFIAVLIIYILIFGDKIKFIELIFMDKSLYNSLKNLIKIKQEYLYNIILCWVNFYVQYEIERENICFQDLIENVDDIFAFQDNFNYILKKGINLLFRFHLYE